MTAVIITAVARPGLGPAARRAARPRRRVRRRDARRGRVREVIDDERRHARSRRRARIRRPTSWPPSAARALRHALAEYELRSYVITPGPPARRDPGPMNRRIPLAPAEGWLTARPRDADVPDPGLGDRRRRAGSSGRAEYLDLPGADRDRRRPGRVHRPEGRLGPLADLPDRRRSSRRCSCRCSSALARPTRTAPRSTTCSRRPPTSVVQAYIDLAVRGLPFDHRSTSTTSSCCGMLVWATCDVRVVRGVRPSPPAQRRDRGRDRPRREHVVHLRERAPVPRPVQRRLAVPADPLARLRRAGRVAPPADRRSVRRISSVYLRGGTVFIAVAVHARSFFLTQTAASAPLAGAWDGVEDGLAQPVAIGLALPADGRLDPAGRPELREQHAGPAVVEHRPGRRR